tara:strand:- start:267 stop:653 length:387 start_codon:yes stop_codon:yes gene_type:complete
MPSRRNSTEGKAPHWTDEIPVSLDGKAKIHKIPQSRDFYFKMWIVEEKRQLRFSLKTDNLDVAYKRGQEEYAKALSMTASGKKLFGQKFDSVCREWLDYQLHRVPKNITKERWSTIKSQIQNPLNPFL